MQNQKRYDAFIKSLEHIAQGGLFFHRIEYEIYITDYNHRLLGVWNLHTGKPCPLREEV